MIVELDVDPIGGVAESILSIALEHTPVPPTKLIYSKRKRESERGTHSQHSTGTHPCPAIQAHLHSTVRESLTTVTYSNMLSRKTILLPAIQTHLWDRESAREESNEHSSQENKCKK